MADVPRDPRQLARDILSGKISIEELARQQQRRAAGGMQRPQPQPRPPERVPLARTPPVAPPRPVIRPAQSIPQRPILRPVAKPSPQRRALPAPPGPRVVTPQAPPAPAVPTEAYTTPTRPASIVAGQLALQKVMKNRMALRQCIVMAEVLGKPLALRDDF